MLFFGRFIEGKRDTSGLCIRRGVLMGLTLACSENKSGGVALAEQPGEHVELFNGASNSGLAPTDSLTNLQLCL